MRPGFSASLTESTWTMARVIGRSNSRWLARAIVSTTGVPGWPRKRRTTSPISSPTIGWPSALTMRSPGSMPAAAAGVPSIAEITCGTPSCTEISMPTPPNWPLVVATSSRYSRSLM